MFCGGSLQKPNGGLVQPLELTLKLLYNPIHIPTVFTSIEYRILHLNPLTVFQVNSEIPIWIYMLV